ncbi:DNA polymerase V [Malonomonas rubra DSM 5091]|uniref:DNA polymerase V n=1 Tax=Malonomonas rubra DSM 5091 TaxID=1122189 RepID=A0A1M6C6B0_MALRU|nr:translesion error-prone DNA polymerase V subunit UmuC [Malonomonas rubra]SHI56597.1 DNA polymerase V [Malonomonas rubra DSM 5091]
MKTVYALVDCNNFYASCERLFDPSLRNTPIIVLSNNDGCVVARSQETKALGIKMAVPAFQIADLVKKHGIRVFSSNYALYGDISSRVMSTLESLAPELEVYSIDEAFLNLTGLRIPDSWEAYGHRIRQTIQQNIGVPVCIGIAPTKTLAKLANYAAKKYPATRGSVDLMAEQRQKKLLEITPVDEVWGVGRKSAQKLKLLGIRSALQLAQMDKSTALKRFSIVLVKIIDELNGIVRFSFEDVPAARQQLMCSRSFAEKMTDYAPLRETICEFAARVAERLRGEEKLCRIINVYARTSMYCPGDPTYSNSATAKLSTPTSDSMAITKTATQLFDSIWKDGYRYAKTGVMLGDLCLKEESQFSLFASTPEQEQQRRLMSTIDQINQKGSKIRFGGQREEENWFMNQAHLSRAYTTRWEDLPEVR